MGGWGEFRTMLLENLNEGGIVEGAPESGVRGHARAGHKGGPSGVHGLRAAVRHTPPLPHSCSGAAARSIPSPRF